MILSGSKSLWVAGVVLFGLVSWTQAAQARSPVHNGGRQHLEKVVAPVLAQGSTQGAQEPTSAAADIWSQLQQADTHYYVLMRHALAPGTGDPDSFQLEECSTQRNLSEEGRAQARRTGEVFRERNVTVQRVLSSEWCRCLDTAELMDLGEVERFPLLNSFFRDRSQGPERTQQLQEFMIDNSGDPGVTVMVTHFVNISAIAGSGVSSGEIVVMQINDQDEPEVVARIEPF